MADQQLESSINLEKLLAELNEARTRLVSLSQQSRQTNQELSAAFASGTTSAAEMIAELNLANKRIEEQRAVITRLKTDLTALSSSNKAFNPDQLRLYQAEILKLQTELKSLRALMEQINKNPVKAPAPAPGATWPASNPFQAPPVQQPAGATVVPGTTQVNEVVTNVSVTGVKEAGDLMFTYQERIAAAAAMSENLKAENKALAVSIKELEVANKKLNDQLSSTLPISKADLQTRRELREQIRVNSAESLLYENRLESNRKQLGNLTNQITVWKDESKKGGAVTEDLGKKATSLGTNIEGAATKASRGGNIFTRLFTQLRFIAAILPGVGFAGLFGLVFTGIATGVGKLIEALTDVKKKFDEIKEARAVEKEIREESIKGSVKETSTLEVLRRIMTSNKFSRQEQIAAMKDYNKIADKANQLQETELGNLSIINGKIQEQTALIERRALARASENIVTKRAEEVLLAEEKARWSAMKQEAAEFDWTQAHRLTITKGGPPIKGLEVGQITHLIDQTTGLMKAITVTQEMLDQLEVSGQKITAEMEQHERDRRIRDLINKDADVQNAKDRMKSALDTAVRLIEIDGYVGDKEKETKEKRVKEAKDFYSKILALQKQLRDAELELMEESRKKEIEQEKDRFKSTIEQLDLQSHEAEREINKIAKQKTISAGDVTALKQLQQVLRLVDMNIEEAEKVHKKKLLDIDKKYYEDALKALTEATDASDQVILQGQALEEKSLKDKYDKIFKQLEEARKKILQTNAKPFQKAEQLITINDTEAKLTEQMKKELLKIEIKSSDDRLKNQQDLATNTLDLLKVTGFDEKLLTEQKEKLKLGVEQEFAKKRLQNLVDNLKISDKLPVEQVTKLFSDENIKKAASTGVDIFTLLGIDGLDDETKQKIIELVAKIREQAKSATEAFTIKGFVGKLLGLDSFEKDALDKAVSSLVELAGKAAAAMEQSIQRRIDAIDREIQKTEEQIQAQQSVVDAQKELAEQGLANNLGIEQQKLDGLNKLRDTEMMEKEKQQKRLEELQKRQAQLQAASIASQGVEQAVNLGTAATKIFKAHADIPIAGILLATAAIATMVATFLAVKNSIKAATSDVPKFRKGTEKGSIDVLDGAPSHEQGGAGLYNEKTGKKLAEFEGGEKLFVMNREKSVRYDKVLREFNNKELSTWTVNQVMGLITGQPIEFDKSSNTTVGGAVINNTTTTNKTEVIIDTREDLLERIAIANERLLHIEQEREIITPMPDGSTIVQKGNSKRIILPKQK